MSRDIGSSYLRICAPYFQVNIDDVAIKVTTTNHHPLHGDYNCLVVSIGKIAEALSQEGKIAVVSSITVFTVASILFFIIDFLCGHFCQKKRKQAAVVTIPPAGSVLTQIPYYDDVVLKKELELKENVAYGQILR